MERGRLYIPCRNNDKENCPLFPECYEDDHHLFARHLGKQAILEANTPEDKAAIRAFIEDPRNKVRSCRDIHRRVLDALPIPLPPIEYIREANQKGT